VFAQAVIAHIDRVEAQEAQSASAQRAAGSAS
jgi:hypothetical protein